MSYTDLLFKAATKPMVTRVAVNAVAGATLGGIAGGAYASHKGEGFGRGFAQGALIGGIGGAAFGFSEKTSLTSMAARKAEGEAVADELVKPKAKINPPKSKPTGPAPKKSAVTPTLGDKNPVSTQQQIRDLEETTKNAKMEQRKAAAQAQVEQVSKKEKLIAEANAKIVGQPTPVSPKVDNVVTTPVVEAPYTPNFNNRVELDSAAEVTKYNSHVSELESARGKPLTTKEKVDLAQKFTESPSDRKAIRDSFLKSEDYVDLPYHTRGITNENKLTWHDFDTDETGEYVYLYRGLVNRAPGKEHLSKMASEGLSVSDIFDKVGTNDLPYILQESSLQTGRWWGSDPVLHTTIDKDIAFRFSGGVGSVVKYKLPKQWFSEQTNNIAMDFGFEKEIDVFYGLPKNFIDTVENISPEIVPY